MVNQWLRKPDKNTPGNRYHYRLSFYFRSLPRGDRIIVSCATNTFIRVLHPILAAAEPLSIDCGTRLTTRADLAHSYFH